MTYEIKCRHCKRFLATVETSVVITLKCSNSACKKLDTYKVSFASEHLYESHTPSNLVKVTTESTADNDVIQEQKDRIAELETKLADMDGRTKEAKELKAKLEETEKYAKSLEGILDGQG